MASKRNYRIVDRIIVSKAFRMQSHQLVIFGLRYSFKLCCQCVVSITFASLSQPPRPLEKFRDDVLDCSKERDVCYHRDLITLKNIGSEDCLHLNVYTPARSDADENLPVMIWIHGGAFQLGSGNSD